MEPSAQNNAFKIGLLLVIGLAIGVGGTFILVSSDYYKNSVLRADSNKAQDTKIPGQSASTTDTGGRKIIIPKSIATESYYISINATVKSFNAIAFLNQDLNLSLNSIKKQNEEKNYENLFNDAVDVKFLLKEGESNLQTLQGNIESLSVANQETKDIAIRSATNKFVTAGREYTIALNNYFVFVDNLLDGTPPNQAELSEVSKKIDAVSTTGTSAAKEMERLIDLINKKVVEISNSLR
jgi:hypothetical protein